MDGNAFRPCAKDPRFINETGLNVVYWTEVAVTTEGCAQFHTRTNGTAVAAAAAAVGQRLRVFWPDDDTFYAGTVTAFDERTGTHEVQYDDGNVEQLQLQGERIELLADGPALAADAEEGARVVKHGADGAPPAKVSAAPEVWGVTLSSGVGGKTEE